MCPLAPALPTVLQWPRPRARQSGGLGSLLCSLCPPTACWGFLGASDLMLKVFFYLVLIACRDGPGLAKGGGVLVLRL